MTSRLPPVSSGAVGALGALGALLLAACAAPEPAPEATLAEPRPPVVATTAVDRAVATTGDVITYTVTVDHDAGLELEIPEPGAEIAGFRIFDLGRDEPEERRGRRIVSRWYKLRADLVGSYVLPPVTVGYRPAGGDGEWRTVETSAIFVEVESVLPAEGGAEDIRGLKPLRPPERAGRWPWIVAGLAALALAAAALWWWRRRPRPLPAPIPAHELAFRELDELRATDFSDPAAVRRFHFRISAVVRAYVEGRWGLNATDLTREEIVAALAGLPELPAAEAGRLRDFLAATDRVKYAEHRPAEAEIRDTWELALGFVEATRPRPVAEPEPARAEREAA